MLSTFSSIAASEPSLCKLKSRTTWAIRSFVGCLLIWCLLGRLRAQVTGLFWRYLHISFDTDFRLSWDVSNLESEVVAKEPSVLNFHVRLWVYVSTVGGVYLFVMYSSMKPIPILLWQNEPDASTHDSRAEDEEDAALFYSDLMPLMVQMLIQTPALSLCYYC